MASTHIMLGVTGSIAVFKACQLVSDWGKRGYETRVAMTAAAQRFVTPLTFASLAHTPVRTAMFPDTADSQDAVDAQRLGISHIDDAKWADVLVIAPATADIIAKIAHGIADDYLTSMVLASRGPKILCPAMNTRMYDNPVTQRNLAECREFGWTVVEPATGVLACQDTGKGKLADLGDIETAVEQALARQQEHDETSQSSAQTGHTPLHHADHRQDESSDLHGLRVLVTAGPTQEPLDPVRYLTNHSTGKMGYALARAAQSMGADVTLVSGPVALDEPDGVHTIHVQTAQEMFDAVRGQFAHADIVIMAAAVGDFRPDHRSEQKIKKTAESTLNITLVHNPDILAWAGEHKRGDGSQVLCGFAMETQDLLANAQSKLERKHCDMLVANDLNEPGAGFAHDTNRVVILTPDTSGTACNRHSGAAQPADEQDRHVHVEPQPLMDKQDLAAVIVSRLAHMRRKHLTH